MADSQEDMGPFKGGRPFKFTDPVALQQAIEAYFDLCDPHLVEQLVESGINQKNETIWATRKVMTQQKPYTTSGLARSLGWRVRNATARLTTLRVNHPGAR
jgi:hypothetical protein